jgi:ATP-dependent RNA helicase
MIEVLMIEICDISRYGYGFKKPSAVQARAILPIFRGRDVIVQSQSGTGKTCVFCVGALQAVSKQVREIKL